MIGPKIITYHVCDECDYASVEIESELPGSCYHAVYCTHPNKGHYYIKDWRCNLRTPEWCPYLKDMNKVIIRAPTFVECNTCIFYDTVSCTLGGGQLCPLSIYNKEHN